MGFIKDDKLTVIDLFSGCGGFTKGFKDAGYNVLLGIDIWEDAINTYSRNFPNTKTLIQDLTTVTGEQVLEIIGCKKNDIDVIIGGPPCQGFSVSGKRMIDDPRNKLYKSFVDIVGYIKPKIFVMENVPGLIRLFDGRVKEDVINDFSELGYEVQCQILTASDYGIPQIRKRVFL